MTSITTTPVTPHQETRRFRNDIATEQATGFQQAAVSMPVQTAPTVTPASSRAQDAFLSKVFDVLHKMGTTTTAPVVPSFDAEDLRDVVARIDAGADGEVTSAAFVAARPDDVSEDDAARLFASLDGEGRGVVDIGNLISALGSYASASDPGTDRSGTLTDLSAALGVDRDQFLASMPQTGTPDEAVKSLLRLLGGKPDGGDQA